jgi:Predicted membrane protein
VPDITAADLDRMRSNLLFDEPGASAKVSRFWVLLVLSAAIASAGVVADSTATVIGAMIVAPLMTPIMGTVLSITTSDRDQLVRSVGMIALGAATAVAVGFLFGLISPIDVVASTSSQVAGRVNPRLIDLTAAIATGAVGSFAQCREDVSDTLPGVAIAISLVPPLTVAGLALEGGEPGQAFGAILLFLTNVAAILLTGVVVMALFGVHTRSYAVASRQLNRRRAVQVVVAFVVAIAIPLGIATAQLTTETLQSARIADVARTWADEAGWTIGGVSRIEGSFDVIAVGPLPAPDAVALRTALDDAGLGNLDVTLRLIPEERIELDGAQDPIAGAPQASRR